MEKPNQQLLSGLYSDNLKSLTLSKYMMKNQISKGY